MGKGIRNCVRIMNVLVICGAILIAGTLILPRLFGYIPYIVTSGSMEPEISTGSIAFINTKNGEIDDNEVIAFSVGDSVVLHRVVSYNKEADSYVTKGDANNTVDVNPVRKSEIIGTYKTSIPEAGFFLAKYIMRSVHIGRFTVPAAPLILYGTVILLNLIEGMLSNLSERG